jgi:hypothetical protein
VALIRNAALGAGAVGLILGGLFATGLVRLGRASESSDATEVAEARDEELGSLGYLGVTKVAPADAGKRGVVRIDRARSEPGLNLYTPTGWGKDTRKLAPSLEPTREAHLVDEQGTVLHSWSAPEAFGSDDRLGWEIAKLDRDLDLVAMHAHEGLLKLDWDSKVVWSLPGNFHHDLSIREDGSILALVERKHTIEHRGRAVQILDAGIAVVSADGVLVSVTWLLESLAAEPFFQAYLDGRMRLVSGADGWDFAADVEKGHADRMRGKAKDWLHANTIDVVDSDLPGVWKAGDFITCFCLANMIVVFDAQSGEVRWHWHGKSELQHPHDPSLLANGNILLFDNGKRRGWSRIIEIDPRTKEIEWTYRGSATEPFFSVKRGLVERLPGGNTMISSTQEGRAFEVTPEGEIVWEFYNPQVVDGYRVATRHLRLDAETSAAVRAELGGAAP